MILCPECYQNKTKLVNKKERTGLYICKNGCCFFNIDIHKEKYTITSREILEMKKYREMWE